MKRRKRILIGLSISFLLATILVAGVTAAKSPFVGAWEAIDSDGSYMILNVGGGPGNYRRVNYIDFGASVCGKDPSTGEILFAASARGFLEESGNTLSGWMDIYCKDHPPYIWNSWFFEFTYDSGTQTIEGWNRH